MKSSIQFIPFLAAMAAALSGVATLQGQTLEEILDLGPGTQGTDLLVNPSPNEPWPAGLFLSADTPDRGYVVLSVDLTQNSPSFGGLVDSFSV
jgi:hypothetical protein